MRMQRISRAPEISATLNLDSCWIIGAPLLRLLQDLDQPPALRARQGAGLDDPNQVALAGLVLRVVGVQGAAPADDLLVLRMAAGDLDLDGDRLVGLARDDPPLPDLPAGGAALDGRRAGAGLPLASLLGPVGGPPLGGQL